MLQTVRWEQNVIVSQNHMIVKKNPSFNDWWITTDRFAAITVCVQVSVITLNKIYPPVIHIWHTKVINKQMTRSTSF
jgi:hypothetical protein